MARNPDTSDLSALEVDDLKYLHDRNRITDQQFADAMEVNVDELTEVLRQQSVPVPLEKVANTGDANTTRKDLAGEDEDDDEDEEEDEEGVDYSSMKNDDLRTEIARRNENRDEDDQLSLMGNKDELIATLEADDEEA